MNLPNLITICRVLVIPLAVASYYLPFHPLNTILAGFWIFIAAVTDWLDGYLARKWQQQSKFGAFLDPVADKLVVATGLILLVDHYQSVWLTIPAVLIIAREIIISALREWMAILGASQVVAVSSIGKWKTTLQLVGIVTLLAFPLENYIPYWPKILIGLPEPVGFIILYAALILTLVSLIKYLRAAVKTLF